MALTIGDPNDPNSPASLFPPPPARVDVTGSQTTRTKQGDTVDVAQPGPEMLEAGKARAAALEGDIAVADKKLGYDTKVAGINADKAAAQVKQDEATDKAKGQISSLYQPDLDKMAEEVKRAHADYQRYEAPKLFANRDGWGNALLAVGLAMGAFGGALKAKAAAKLGQVSNDDPVGDIVRMDLERQREAIKHLTDKELAAKTGLKDRRDALAVELSKVDAKGAEMYKRIAQVAEMRLQNLGIEAAEIERDGTVAKAREAAAAAQTAAASGLTRRVTEHGETVSRQSEARTTVNTPAAVTQASPTLNVYAGKEVAGQLPATGDKELDRDRQKKVTESNQTYTDLRSTLQELHDLETQGVARPSMAGVPGSDLGVKREALHAAALLQLKELAKLGVLAGPDMKIMEQQLGGNSQVAAGVGTSRIGTMIDIVDKRHEKFLNGVGLDGPKVARRLRGEPEQPAAPAAPAPYTTPPMIPGAKPPGPGAPTVVRTGTRNGKRVEQLSDGTIREVQ